MIELTPKPGDPDPFLHYFRARRYADLDANTRTSLRRQRDRGTMPGHAHIGYVTLNQSELAFHFRTPEDRMDDLMEAIHKTATLLMSWKQGSAGSHDKTQIK